MRTPHGGTIGPALLLLAACNTDVTNPGLVRDEDLDKPEAWPAVVLGARRTLANAIGSSATNGGQLLYWTAAVSYEINPAGSTGSFGIPPDVQGGLLTPSTTSDDWTSANVARFVPEAAVRRFRRVMPDTTFAKSPFVAQAYLYAGYANRLLGETFCQSVLPVEVTPDSLGPGTLAPHTRYFLRADTAFTNAIAVFTATGKTDTQTVNFLRAAHAGRAQVRAQLATYGLASWTDAVTDAGQVPDTTRFLVPYFSQTSDQYNYLYWARANSPYRAHTQWGTFYEGYYRTTGDPRVRWDSTTTADSLGDAAVAKFGGHVPFWPEAKYTTRDAAVRASSGWEMRLIEAEAALVSGSAPAAVDSMNRRRANLGLPLYDRTVTVDSAWSLLKLERAIELWLEARRLGDLRRWLDNGVLGAYVDGLYRANRADTLHSTPIETMTSPVARSLCFPVGQNEIETNPNIP